MQSIVRRGFFDEQPASVIQEVAGFAFAITDGDAVAVFVIGVVGVGARHIPLADDPRIGIQPPLPAVAVRGDNGDQLLALFVVLVTPGAILCIRPRGEQVKGAVALTPQCPVAVHIAQQVVMLVVLAFFFFLVGAYQLLRQLPARTTISQPVLRAVRPLPLHDSVLLVIAQLLGAPQRITGTQQSLAMIVTQPRLNLACLIAHLRQQAVAVPGKSYFASIRPRELLWVASLIERPLPDAPQWVGDTA
ncbi:hypothetical protein PB16LOC_04576 [Pectobacterium versatile]|nr:hypothetical protein PB16LOC_04576 [Pectobacterium versatile]